MPATGATRNDLRGAWALLVLLCPIGMLWLHPLAEELAVSLYGGGPNADWTTLATAAIIVAVAAAIVVSAVLMVQRRVVLTHAAVAAAPVGAQTGQLDSHPGHSPA